MQAIDERITYHFAVDRSLGKLSKLLRLVGFDTKCEPAQTMGNEFWQTLPSQYMLLVRSRHLLHYWAAKEPLLIISNAPMEQLGQVICKFRLTERDLKPFSRCTLCNLPLSKVTKQALQGEIPDYVWHTQPTFQKCMCCGRAYWSGSHKSNMMDQLKKHVKQTLPAWS